MGGYTNPQAYNVGQDVGDALSIVGGAFESVQGGTIIGGSIVAAPESGGISLSGVGVRLIKLLHGFGMIASGSNSLSSKKGRVYEISSSENSAGGGKNAKHANQKILREKTIVRIQKAIDNEKIHIYI